MAEIKHFRFAEDAVLHWVPGNGVNLLRIDEQIAVQDRYWTAKCIDPITVIWAWPAEF